MIVIAAGPAVYADTKVELAFRDARRPRRWHPAIAGYL